MPWIVDRRGRDPTLAFVLRVGAGCLLVAGAVALWAVATGDVGRTDGKLIGTSIGFGVFSAFAASGAALAGRRGQTWRPVLGVAGVLSAIAAFALLLAALWLPDPADDLWRWWAATGIVALWCWHAGVILGPRRAGDGGALVVASAVAVGALGLDALVSIAAIAGWVGRHRDPGLARAFAAVLIVAVVASVLVPLLRRLQRTAAPLPGSVAPPGRPAGTAPPPEHSPFTAAPRRSPSLVLAAAWREGDSLTRALLVACAVVPLVAGFAVALAWPGSPAPATPGTVTVHAPPVTVAGPPVTVTQVPPERASPDPGSRGSGGSTDDFGAADAAGVIARRRARFDRRATRSALALAPIVERCFARSEDFTICDTPAELPAAAKAGLSLGMGEAQVAVVASTVGTYEIAARSLTGSTFTLSRDARGALRRTCVTAGAGGCRSDGTW